MKPECRVDASGNKWWYLNEEFHREDGPAVELANGTKEWYQNGEHHREDGPAIEWFNGERYWCLNGKQLIKEDFTNIEMVIQLQALELFTPKELVKLRNG